MSEVKTALHTYIPDPKKEKSAENAIFYITDDFLGTGTVSEKFKANISAIRTLKGLEADGRSVTTEERDTLSRYVEWGGLAQAFEDGRAQNAELKSLLTEQEYADARGSVLNSHYTPPVVIDTMY